MSSTSAGQLISKKNLLLLLCILSFPPDLKDKEIFQKVCNEEQRTVTEPLPDNCPKELEQLINSCRAYSDFERPSSGGKNIITSNTLANNSNFIKGDCHPKGKSKICFFP